MNTTYTFKINLVLKLMNIKTKDWLCQNWLLLAWIYPFSFVINFIDDDLVSHHVIIGMFEAPDASGVTLVEQVKSLLVIY
jgi:hypothetical protein